MYFELMHTRLVGHLRAVVRSGELTERRLARRTGVSQSHLHNVLKGVRVLSAQMADQVVTQLRLSALDLLAESELGQPLRGGARKPGHAQAPLLAGRLGPGHPFPDLQRHDGVLPFREQELAGIVEPVALRLAPDRQQESLFRGEDIALLAPCPENGLSPAGELAAGSYYAVDLGGTSLVRRVEHCAGRLYLLPEDPAAPVGCISVADRHILDVLRARVIWIGRYLERFPIADRPLEEAGGKDRPPGGEG